MSDDSKNRKMDNTSWGQVASWYDDLLSGGLGTYQAEVILPNLLRLLDIKKGEVVLDLACGQGFFSQRFDASGAKVLAVDISRELIAIGRKNVPSVNFFVSPAHRLPFIKNGEVDKAVIVLAIQNIKEVAEVFAECARVLRGGGRLIIVMNHPAFRIPGKSSWGFDEKNLVQYRRVDSYMAESKQEIIMNPSAQTKVTTTSFHRPLQFYFKLLAKSGLVVLRLEEWVSNKTSEKGLRSGAENRARKEFPLFLSLEIKKI